jgi:alanine-synthesizing transaminase
MVPARILIVEDERSIRTLLRTYLTSEGHEIEEAANGQEAMDAVTQEPPPDIVLLDLSIPAPQGMEILHRLKNMAVRPRPRVIVLTIPHNPTTACVDLDFMQRMVDFAREHEVLLVHDFAYADLGFDGYDPPSILQVPGASDVAVELYTLTKSFSMAGWRIGFLLGNADVVAALAKLKSYLDYGTFQPIQIAATVTMNEAPDYPMEANAIYRGRRNALIDGLSRVGWEIERPQGTMFVWAPIPEPYEELGSLEFAKLLVREAKVAVSPGVGFGPGGEGFVRFALVENEHRINQAVRGIKRALPKLG